jgi:hypothetical protein
MLSIVGVIGCSDSSDDNAIIDEDTVAIMHDCVE